MKQTAVEWLIEQLIPKDQHEGIIDIIEEAKEMEKEQKYTEKEMLDYGRFCVQCEKQGFIIPKNK